jgi:hypothetical protein
LAAHSGASLVCGAAELTTAPPDRGSSCPDRTP